LNIAEDKEVGRLSPCRRHLKALRIRPYLPVTHLIVVGTSGPQAGEPHPIAAQGIAMLALHKGLKHRASLHCLGFAEVWVGGIPHLRHSSGAIDLGEPGDTLCTGFGHSVGQNTKGLAAIFHCLFADDHPLVPGTACARLFRIEGILSRRIKGMGQLPLHIRLTHAYRGVRAVHLINGRAGDGIAVCVCHSQLRGHPDNSPFAAELIARRQRDLLLRAGEGIGLAALRTVVNGIAALRDGISQCVTLRSIRGNADDEVSQLRHIAIFSCGFRSEEPCQQ